ncbi:MULTISPECIES: histidine kinase [Actinosynnema]|uniref:histidine kinase n=1 Tax=Actinosynnema TaxID=40566 RepID=UPI000AD476ED|nr:histidine kinase [Actinosynnema pretiosum]
MTVPQSPLPTRLPPWARVALGTSVVVVTYAYLIATRPTSPHGVGGSAALLALGGYLLGSVLIVSGAMARLSASTVTLFPVAITINIVVGQVVRISGLPVHLDSIGTVLVGVLAGPAAGAATGALSSITVGMTINPGSLPYAVTAATIGLLAGTFSRFGLFRRAPTVVLAGVLIGVVAGVVSAPITAFVFGNAGGSLGQSVFIATLQVYGNSMLEAASLQGLIADPLDKVASCLLASAVLANLPARLRQRFPFAREHDVFGLERAARAGVAA